MDVISVTMCTFFKTNEEEIQGIAGRPENIFIVETFNALLSSAIDIFKFMPSCK